MYTNQILSKIKKLQPSYLPLWKPDEEDAGWAVARTFANFLSGLEEQKDKLPQKLFIAYLDSLGFSQNPPLAAKTPVTFLLTKNFKGSALIPKGTLLETKSKVNFETTKSIMASATKLVTLVDCGQTYINNHAESLASHEPFKLFVPSVDNNDNSYIYFGDNVLFDLAKISSSSGTLEYFGITNTDSNPKWRTLTNTKTKVHDRKNYSVRVKTKDNTVTLTYQQVSIDALFYNNTPLPIPNENPIKPFGAIPQINDSFYIASREAFSKKNGKVKIVFSYPTSPPSFPASISWEYWNGNSWKNLTVDTNTNTFIVPQDIHLTKVNGEENYWVRLRLLDNNEYVNYECQNNTWKRKFTAPSLTSITLTLSSVPAESTNTDQNPCKSDEKALYFAFDKPFGSGLFSMYIDMVERENSTKQSLDWEYSSNENTWKDLEAKDGTNGFSQSGYCQFIAPNDQERVEHFGLFAYWVKVNCKNKGNDKGIDTPTLKGIYLNSIEAKEGKTIEHMLLGSSDGSGSQKFMVNDTPLFDLKLWVLEPSLPEGYTSYEDTLGDGYWVLWSQIERLGYASASQRVFTLDSFSGEVHFGDDTEGKIPILGKDNIMVSYRIGGGKRGNVLAGEVSKLVDTVAFVDKVKNPIDTSGGSDLQSIENLIEMAPKRIKHRYRAVSREDYTYIVREASSNVAKVAVVNKGEGHLDLHIVPFSKQGKPRLSIGLKNTVQAHIDCVSPAAATVRVQEPNYVALDLAITIGLEDLSFASTMKNSINDALKRFLHPIDGNHHGEGWEFGILPSLVDFYELFDKIEGIEIIETLKIVLPDKKNYSLNVQTIPTLTKNQLICNGKHIITLDTASKPSGQKCQSNYSALLGITPKLVSQLCNDLTEVVGIGKVYQNRLHDEGIFTYEEITNMTQAQVNMMEGTYAFKGDFTNSIEDTKRLMSEIEDTEEKSYYKKSIDQTCDDLTKVVGIGKVYQNNLHAEGIFTYEEIANMTQAQVNIMENKYVFKGNFKNSLKDAKKLADKKDA